MPLLCIYFVFVSPITKLFHEKQLVGGRWSETEESFHQKIILFASMKKLKKEKQMKHI